MKDQKAEMKDERPVTPENEAADHSIRLTPAASPTPPWWVAGPGRQIRF
jgi:hypothetical protein